MDLQTPRDRLVLIALTGALLMITALAMDIMLPAFPVMAAAYGIGEAAVQRVLTVFLIGYAVPHLLIGSVADRFGRRPVLLAGLGVYFFGGLICLWAPSFGWLLAGRLVQGLGAAAGPILARAVLRDLFQGAELGRHLSFAMAFFAAGPVLAPSIGALILTLTGWKAIFAFLCVVAALLLLWVWRWLPETLTQADESALTARRILGNARSVLAHPQSGPVLVMVSVSFGTLIAYLVSSPAIFIGYYGVNEGGFALIFALISCATFLAQFANAALLRRYTPGQIFAVVLLCFPVVTGLLLVQTALGLATIPSLTMNLAAFLACFSLTLANGTTLVIDPHRHQAGVASGLLGFSQLLVGTGIGSLIGSFADRGPVPLALGTTVIAAVVLGLILVTRGRRMSVSRPQA